MGTGWSHSSVSAAWDYASHDLVEDGISVRYTVPRYKCIITDKFRTNLNAGDN